MPLRYLIDEDLRGPLWYGIARHNAAGVDPVDAIRVGDAGAPPTGTKDDRLLAWAASNDRILVTFDKSTMQGHLTRHLADRASSPGVFQLRPSASIADVIEYLVCAAHASDPQEWRDTCWFIP